MTGLEELDADALDFASLDEPPAALSDAYRGSDERDPWLRRRTHAWGGSEVAPLLTAYGLAPLDATSPRWVTEQAEHYKRLGIPKLIAWKSGLRARPKGDVVSMSRGNDREKELFDRYRLGLARRRVDPRSMRYADRFPREWFPLVDRRSHRLAVTPDAVARDHQGGLVAIELKCTFKECSALPWHYRAQLEAEMATMEAVGGLLVVGERWVDDTSPDGPIRAFAVRPDPQFAELLRLVCIEAWHVVTELRDVARRVDELGTSAADKREKKRLAEEAAETWRKSHARMQSHRDDDVAHLDQVLADLEGLDDLTDYAA